MKTIKLTQHPITIRQLQESDNLVSFCYRCKELGYKNNESLSALKYDFVKEKRGNFIVAIDDRTNEIFSISGYHYFDDYQPNAWRVFFRSAQLPNYNIGKGMGYFNNSLHLSHMLYLQIARILEADPNAILVGCSNVGKDSSTNMKTDKMNRAISKRLATLAGLKNKDSNVMLYNTLQNVWVVDVNQYLANRDKLLDHSSYTIDYLI